jgi:hypothetical protein
MFLKSRPTLHSILDNQNQANQSIFVEKSGKNLVGLSPGDREYLKFGPDQSNLHIEHYHCKCFLD